MTITAAFERNAPLAASSALLDMAAQRDVAASLDRGHDKVLYAAERVLLAIGSPEPAIDVRYLEPGGAQRGLQK